MVPGIALKSTDGAYSFHQEALSMFRRKNNPNYSFLIETFTPDGERLLFWRIDQVCSNINCSATVNRLTNQVESHLHGLYERTGLGYSCFAQGPKGEIDEAIAAHGIEVS